MALQAAAVVHASAARTATGNGTLFDVTPGASSLALYIDVTSASGTTPTLDLTVEWSPDGGTTWHTAQAPDAFTQITAAGKVVKVFAVKGPSARIVYTIGGTTPSFTFKASAVPL